MVATADDRVRQRANPEVTGCRRPMWVPKIRQRTSIPARPAVALALVCAACWLIALRMATTGTPSRRPVGLWSLAIHNGGDCCSRLALPGPPGAAARPTAAGYFCSWTGTCWSQICSVRFGNRFGMDTEVRPGVGIRDPKGRARGR